MPREVVISPTVDILQFLQVRNLIALQILSDSSYLYYILFNNSINMMAGIIIFRNGFIYMKLIENSCLLHVPVFYETSPNLPVGEVDY